MILLQFKSETIIVGLSCAPLIILYPFMKRITFWPQLFLGIVFNWGIIICSVEFFGTITREFFILYLACIFWTIGYDTIYAHQDKDDDLLLNLKSSAIKLGENTKYAMLIFYSIFFIIFAVILLNLSNSLIIHIAILSLLVHLVSQIIYLDIDNSERCLKTFKSNNLLGIQISFFLILEVLIN